jgi:hypothetical protein
MDKDLDKRIAGTISGFPLLYVFLNETFIKQQCSSGLKNFLLFHSHNVQALQYLENILQRLSCYKGYERLGPRLRNACDWDAYQETLAQIEATVWFSQKSVLKEIEPALRHKTGSCDILLTFEEQEIYCEVWSAQSFQRAINLKIGEEARRAKELVMKEPWMSQQDAEHEIRNRGVIRTLMAKTNHQLPPDKPGVLAINGSKSLLFHFSVKEVSEHLFPKRPQVALTMLWSLEGGSQIGEPPFCFVNPNSPFVDLARKFLAQIERTNLML